MVSTCGESETNAEQTPSCMVKTVEVKDSHSG